MIKKTAHNLVQSSKFPPAKAWHWRAGKVQSCSSPQEFLQNSTGQAKFKVFELCVLVLSFAFCTLSLMFPKSVKAQILSLSPASATKTMGEGFDVDLNIDTKGKAVAGTDVKVTFDAAALEIVKITDGDFFGDNGNNLGVGTLYIMGSFREEFGTKTGSGKVATITLKGKKEGIAQLTFVCTTQTNDTNISDASGNDIIDCAGTKNGSYTIIAGGSSPTNTPTPTPTTGGGGQSPTATATPPVSGISLPTVFSLGAGVLLIILGIAGVIII